MPIPDFNTGAVQPLTGVEGVRGMPKVQKFQKEAPGRPLKPEMDEYVPAEKRESSGCYWMGKDKDGQPQIYIDGLEKAPDGKKSEADHHGAEKSKQDTGAKGLEKKAGKKEERWAGNTDKVDREIAKLKKEQQKLEQQLRTETDEDQIKILERQLAQVEQALNEKDCDAYRKQHSTFTRLA